MNFCVRNIGESCCQCQKNGRPAQRVDAEGTTDEKAAGAMKSGRAMHGKHQHQARMNKEKHNASETEIGEKLIGRGVVTANTKVYALMP
jgi:hypothetical protein